MGFGYISVGTMPWLVCQLRSQRERVKGGGLRERAGTFPEEAIPSPPPPRITENALVRVHQEGGQGTTGRAEPEFISLQIKRKESPRRINREPEGTDSPR